jgi:hypothetical protein
VGLFQLNGPNSKHALVEHGHFQLQPNVLVRFIDPADAENHRAVQGYRRGWLMFLGVPPDFRNDLDITNAVSTFGQYHYWNNLDPIKSRILVYASFPSVATVPRDVVFGKFGTVGGFRESWTAAVFVLSAEFAEQLPPDEDPMPPNGNPHPMPGQLQPFLNNFVPPQYPEMGWNEQQVEHIGADADNNHGGNMDLEQEVVPEAQESMVLQPSEGSLSSVNNEEEGIQQPGNINLDLALGLLPDPLHNIQGNNQIVHVGLMVHGPTLPPAMQWDNVCKMMLPSIFSDLLPVAPMGSPLGFLKSVSVHKRTWSVAFDEGRKLLLAFLQEPVLQRVVMDRRRKVARELKFDFSNDCSLESVPFSATPESMGKISVKSRGKKKVNQVVQPSERRFTRSSLKLDGYKAKPVDALKQTPRKKPRAKMLLVTTPPGEESSTKKNQQQDQGNSAEDDQIPATPINVLQRVGTHLGIDRAKITKEKLEADPKNKAQSSSDD